MPHKHRTGDGEAAEVIVVGAGLAGLACATDLLRAGRSVRVLEASDAVGGRMRTDRKDGFLLDRGFQVFNTSYPQVKRRLHLAELWLRPFTPGALVHTGQDQLRFADPTRRPADCGDLRPGRLASGRDLLALAALSARDMLGPACGLKKRPDSTTLTALADAGISPDLVETFFRPFLAGIFLEDELETSARFFHLVWRSMLRGTLCLPATGIGAVPEQLARLLPPRTVELETPVRAVTDSGVLLDDGSERAARTVVVATGPGAASRLLPGLESPPTRTVTTHYHAASEPPLREPTLLLDSALRVLNTCVVSEVVPTYAPEGRSLIATSVLGDGTDGEDKSGGGGGSGGENRSGGRSHGAPSSRCMDTLAEIYGTDTADWEHLASYTVPGALPAMRPPWPLSRTTRVAPGRYVCGDHRATGSVQGALASGTRAAREILATAPTPPTAASRN